MSKRLFWLLFILVVLFGAFFRLYKLGSIPISLYWDEMAMLVDARSISETGRDIHNKPWLQALFISYGDFKLPIYIWLAGLSVKLIGISEFALRLPSAIAGIATIILSGVIARILFFGDTISINSKKIKNNLNLHKYILTLSVMFTVAASPWSILFSRTAFEGHVGQFWLSVSILLVLLSKKKKYFLYISPLVASLATYTYFSVRFAWVPVFILLITLMNWNNITKSFNIFIKNRKFKSLYPIVSFVILSIFVPLLIFALSLLPMIKSPLYADSNKFRYGTDSVLNMKDWPVISNQYREMGGNGKIDRVLYHRYVFPVKELLKNYSDNLSLDYIFITGDPNLRHSTGHHGLFLLIFLPIFLIGIYQLAKEYRPQLLLLSFWWIVAILPASVPENTPHALRSLNALVPLAMIIGFGLYKLIYWISQQKFKYIYFSGLFLAMLISILDFYSYYFIQYPKISASDWQGGYKEVAQEIIKNKDSVDEVWVGPFDDRFYLWLLGYSDYSFEEIQNWETEGYQFKEFDNIKFDKIQWDTLDTNGKTIMVIGRKNNIDSRIKGTIREPVIEEYIPNNMTSDEFIYKIYR